VNVYKLAFKIKWADVNDCGMTGPRGTKMMKSFMAHGIESMLIERTIRVVMSPEWLTGTTPESPEGLKIMELPVLTLTPEGIEARMRNRSDRWREWGVMEVLKDIVLWLRNRLQCSSRKLID
jgi:hypothetical protein